MGLGTDDPRTVAELFETALSPGDDEDMRVDALAALHRRGSREVFDRAVELCRSADTKERSLGADVLGQLGIPERTFPEEGFNALVDLLSDSDAEPLCSAIVALSHLDAERAAAHIIPFSGHPDASVRYATAFALSGVEHADASDALVALSSDRDGDVRNWATFALGKSSADTLAIREALSARLDDESEDVRYEAIIGLARRRDARMTGFVKNLLQDDSGDVFAKEAATRLLGLEFRANKATTDLLGALQRQQKWARRRP